MTCNGTVTKSQIATASLQVRCRLPASTLSVVTSSAACGHLLPEWAFGLPRLQGRSLVSPSMIGCQCMCKHYYEGPASERALTFTAHQSSQRDASGHGGLHHPSNAGVQGHLHR